MGALHIMNYFILVLLGVMYVFMPRLMNKYLLFGVTVNDDILSTDEISDIKRLYKLRMSLTTLFIVIIYTVVLIILSDAAVVIWFVVLLLLEIVIMSVFYLLAHFGVKKLKGDPVEPKRMVSTEIGEETEIKVLPAWSYLLYLAVIIGVVWYSFSIYDSIPDVIAIHFDANGVADDFADKSVMYILLMPIMMMFMTLLFVGVNYSFKIAKKVSGRARGRLTIEQEKKYRFVWSVGMFIFGFILILLFAVIQMFSIEVFTQTELIMWITVMSTVAIILLVGILAVTMGQSGSRVKTDEVNTEIVDADDDEFWKLGSFYYNKQDPTLFVNKRFGIGMTLNFGNKWAWVFVGAILLLVVGSLILPFML